MIKLKNMLVESMDVRKVIDSVIKKVSNKLHCNMSGACIPAAEEITRELLQRGITNFKVIEGWVKQPSGRYGPKTQHTWIEMEDGKLIDITFGQFEPKSTYISKIYKIYSPQEYAIPHPKDVEFRKRYPDHNKQFYKR